MKKSRTLLYSFKIGDYSHIVYIVMISFSICFSEFLKRFIFINGPVSSLLYYACIFFPLFVLFIYVFAGNLNVDITRCIIFFSFIIIQFIVVTLFNRSKIGSLIIYLGGSLIYVFPFIFTVSCKTNKYSYFLLYLLIIAVVYGFIQHSIGYFIWEWNWDKFSPTKISVFATSNFGSFSRAFSVFSGVQDFSLFIIFTVILLFVNSVGNGIKTLLLFILLSGLYIAGAKSMMISLLISYIIYIFRKKINPFLLFILVYLLPYIIIMGFYIVFKDIIHYYLINMAGLFNFGTILPRLEIIYNFLTSLEITILGIGSGCMEGVVDNMYIRILVENGIMGLITFMFLLYKTIKKLCYIEKFNEYNQTENKFYWLLFIVITFSMHSGELLISRFSMIIFIYLIVSINTKYNMIKSKT